MGTQKVPPQFWETSISFREEAEAAAAAPAALCSSYFGAAVHTIRTFFDTFAVDVDAYPRQNWDLRETS